MTKKSLNLAACSTACQVVSVSRFIAEYDAHIRCPQNHEKCINLDFLGHFVVFRAQNESTRPWYWMDAQQAFETHYINCMVILFHFHWTYDMTGEHKQRHDMMHTCTYSFLDHFIVRMWTWVNTTVIFYNVEAECVVWTTVSAPHAFINVWNVMGYSSVKTK